MAGTVRGARQPEGEGTVVILKPKDDIIISHIFTNEETETQRRLSNLPKVTQQAAHPGF